MDIDIRHVPVDKLAASADASLSAREARLVALREEYEVRITQLREALEEAERIADFLQREYDNVLLAQKLARGDVVRVVCPVCKGTGMRPSNVAGGQISKGTAFESVGASKTTQAPVIDEHNRCRECSGQRWVIMERFKG